MPLFRRSSPAAPAEPWPWWRRHKITCGVVVAVLVAGALVAWRPWQACGPGMTSAAESPGICVGLNLESGAFRAGDPLADLEKKVAEHNAEIRQNAKESGSDFITIVHVNDMAPVPGRDSASLENVRHGIQGALTAVSQEENPVALLLANYGPGGAAQQQARDQIMRAQQSQHIVAVTGLGQSLETTRSLAKGLSDDGIAVVGALTSGDDMNQAPGTEPAEPGHFIENFFRITPTNTDAAKAAVSYLQKHEEKYPKVMRVQDKNPRDGYSATLGEAFRQAYAQRFGPEENVRNFNSPPERLNDLDRDKYMFNTFTDMRGEICNYKPDLIYFAGRGVDISSFVRAMTDGECGIPSPLTVLTSDDATSIINKKLESHGKPLQVLYTGAGTRGQWDGVAAMQPDNADNYGAFESEFGRKFSNLNDLVDGYAMSNYDAVKLAAEAARKSISPVKNRTLVASTIKNSVNCADPFLGATGKIAFSAESHGNPINKAIPIMEIDPAENTQQQDLVWSDGVPFDDSCR